MIKKTLEAHLNTDAPGEEGQRAVRTDDTAEEQCGSFSVKLQDSVCKHLAEEGRCRTCSKESINDQEVARGSRVPAVRESDECTVKLVQGCVTGFEEVTGNRVEALVTAFTWQLVSVAIEADSVLTLTQLEGPHGWSVVATTFDL